MILHLPKRLIRDNRGAAIIEFGILAPILLAMLMGVLLVGMYMQSYNSLRAVSADISRFTVVQYQRDNELKAAQISLIARSIANRPQYQLENQHLDIDVAKVDSFISGADKYTMTMKYTPPNVVGLLGLEPPQITRVQSIIVPD